LSGWRIDPSRDRLCRRLGLFFDEAFGVFAEGAIERDLTGGVDLVGLNSACRGPATNASPLACDGDYGGIALTGHRRGSGTQVAFEDIEFKDPHGNPGWGLATWQPDVMKAQHAFTLPIPPLGLHIIRCCKRDWKEAAERSGIKVRKSKWVFASRVVQSMAADIAVTGSAMANHIRNLRGLRTGNYKDVIRRIPPFSMHIIRSTMGDFILEESGLPPGTASLMIGHEIAGDRKSELDRVGQTGKRWYFQAQRIPEKTRAMELWSAALLKAFETAGGLPA